uniref:Large ribosomal subunit protein uL22m n=1 Tax=Gopherus agassizii TaxID=38772 RepID=A0A452J4D0_9SAUR
SLTPRFAVVGAAWARNLLSWARLLASCSISLLSDIQTRTYLQNAGRWEKKNRIVYPPQLPGEPRRPAQTQSKIWVFLASLIHNCMSKGAQEMAVRKHNVEFKSNLHIADSFSGKGHYLKRIRYHGRGMFGIMEKVKCHYFVKLVEGPPPPPEAPKTGFDQAKEYVQQLRNRTIIHTL